MNTQKKDRTSLSASQSGRAAVTAWLGSIFFAAIVPGCGSSDSLPRTAVEGNVTLDGQPLGRGSIVFLPIEGTQGPQVGGEITDGKYQISRHQGPVIGNLRVEIRAEPGLAFDITDPEAYAPHVRDPMPRNAVPPVYNDRSKLKVETRGKGDNRFDFALQSQPRSGP